MRKAMIAIGAIALLGASCHWLWPEHLAVNAPVAHMLFGRGAGTPDENVLGRLRVPDGFSIGVWAEGVAGARFLHFSETGDLLVSRSRAGEIVLLEADRDGDDRSDGRRVLLADLNRPHGIELHDGALYVAETDAVVKASFDARSGSVSGDPERIVTGIPGGGGHWTRSLAFGPDGNLYVSVGSSCNVCVEDDPRRAALLRYAPDGSGEEIYASGLRNAVGFDWRPETGELYATDNGRDLLGDDFPPCELNRVVRGGFYGWPVANGDRVPDPDLGEGEAERIARSIPPVHDFRAHNAPLGIRFVRGERAPEAYRGTALVALHGSWNRTQKDGYKVVSLHWPSDGDPDGRIEERDFVVGFESDGDVIGRPVDIAEGPDGAFYVSDDYAGLVWRVAASGAGPRSPLRTAAAESGTSAAGSPGSERGRRLYEENACATCHEAERAAAGVVPVSLDGLADRYDRESLAALLETPPPPMPAVALSDEERRALATHLLARFR